MFREIPCSHSGNRKKFDLKNTNKWPRPSESEPCFSWSTVVPGWHALEAGGICWGGSPMSSVGNRVLGGSTDLTNNLASVVDCEIRLRETQIKREKITLSYFHIAPSSMGLFAYLACAYLDLGLGLTGWAFIRAWTIGGGRRWIRGGIGSPKKKFKGVFCRGNQNLRIQSTHPSQRLFD